MTNIALTCTDVRIAYERGLEIVRGIALNVERDSITTIIGPNGAGKSTLLKGIGGVAPVVGGDIRFEGDSLLGLSPSRRLELGVAFVPQERSAFDEMTVEENLRLGAWLFRSDKRRVASALSEVCALFPVIAERLRRPAGSLSGGQRKLLEVARGLMSNPRLILLDEPTAGLAPAVASSVYEQMAALRENGGVTMLLVDQNVREALKVSDTVHAIVMGRNAATGTAAEIEERLDDIVRDWMVASASQ